MKPDDRDAAVDRLMDGLEPPQPPPDLRLKAIAAARARMAATPMTNGWSTIWNHRAVRLAWAGAAALLLAGHVFLVPRDGAVPSRVAPALVGEDRVDEQFVELLHPTAISDTVQPVIGLFAAGGSLTDLDLEGNPS